MVLIFIGNVYIFVTNPLPQGNLVLIIEVSLTIVLFNIGERIAYSESLCGQATACPTLFDVVAQTYLRPHHLHSSKVLVPQGLDIRLS